MTESQERESKILSNGDEVFEAGDDCQFVASPSGTVHERDEWPGDAHDYNLYPRCGQRLPPGSLWARVDADSAEEIAEEYDLSFCSKCFLNALELEAISRGDR